MFKKVLNTREYVIDNNKLMKLTVYEDGSRVVNQLRELTAKDRKKYNLPESSIVEEKIVASVGFIAPVPVVEVTPVKIPAQKGLTTSENIRATKK
jgi:hypothetical protein